MDGVNALTEPLRVLTVADPVLQQKARPVEPDEFGPEMVLYRDRLVDAMMEHQGAGLAAPQVGDSRRILVMRTQSDGPIFMANPVIQRKSQRISSRKEGCLSIPGERVSVKRPAFVEVSYTDAKGSKRSRTIQGFEAAVVQHEMDHLDGVTLLDKMKHYNRTRYLKRLSP